MVSESFSETASVFFVDAVEEQISFLVFAEDLLFLIAVAEGLLCVLEPCNLKDEEEVTLADFFLASSARMAGARVCIIASKEVFSEADKPTSKEKTIFVIFFFLN